MRNRFVSERENAKMAEEASKAANCAKNDPMFFDSIVPGRRKVTKRSLGLAFAACCGNTTVLV